MRFSAGGGVWRVAFAFDGNRVAVLLAAANKGGKDQDRFHRAMMELAEDKVGHMESVVKKGIPFQDFVASLPAEEQEAIRIRSQELIEQELTLRDLRKAMGQTQETLAAKLGVKQENVSRVEARADMLLSTLGGYIEAMGGKLKLTVEFEGRAPLVLAGFSADGRAAVPGRRRRKAAAG